MGEIKKRMLVLLALLLIISCSSTQIGSNNINSNLKMQLKLLQLPQDFEIKKDTIGFSKLKNAKFYTINGDNDVFTIDVNHIHLVDFNKDGLKDIIYQENQPYISTVLFANNGKDFVEVWNGSGKPVNITHKRETTIAVYSPYIGCMESNILFSLTIDAKNNLTEDRLSYHNKTQFNTLDTQFLSKETSGILRSTPEVDNTETKDPCTGAKIAGNQIKTINNHIVTVIKEGKEWSLVAYKKSNNSIIAWIKNKKN